MRTIAGIFGRLPEGFVDGLARSLAWLAFDLLRLRRKVVSRNLGIAFPDKTPAERDAIGRASYYNFFLTVFEFLRSGQVDITQDIQLQGDEHLRKALDEGRGAYVLCFHLGNWEAMGAKYTRTLVPSHVLVKKVGSAGVDRFVGEMRAKNGFLTVARRKKGDGLRGIIEVLKKNEVVGFVMDQARPGEPRLPFFGAPAKTNTSFAAIWRRHPAPIIPSYILRRGIGKHTAVILPPVVPSVTGDAEADILAHSTMFNKVVEDCVRQAPEQYLWMHNRWK